MTTIENLMLVIFGPHGCYRVCVLYVSRVFLLFLNHILTLLPFSRTQVLLELKFEVGAPGLDVSFKSERADLWPMALSAVTQLLS